MIVPEAEPALASPSQASLWATDLAIQADATFWELYLPQQNLELDGNIDDLYLAPWVRPSHGPLHEIADSTLSVV